VTGDVNISHCKFVNNNHHRGHGAAIHYSSNNTLNYSQLVFTINNCNFTHNKGNKLSVIYIGQSEKKKPECNKNITISFNNSIFYGNQGVSVYAVNQKFHLHGKNLLQNNKAKKAAGIYVSDHSTVIFDENSDVAFIHNSANFKGGAVFLRNHSTVLFNENSLVKFIIIMLPMVLFTLRLALM